MPVRHLLFLLFGLTAWQAVPAQGIEFFHGSWDEAMMKAKTEDKLIFVDAFAVWCGPCKNMAANTFTREEVGSYFNANFIPMKIDMEKEMGLEFRKKYPVSAYPTLFFIDPDGEVVQKSVGAKSPADLLALAEMVISKYDKSVKYAAVYDAGDRSYELVYNYIAALNKSGKPSTKIANDFLAEQKDLTTPENLRFILEAATQVDCQCFDLLEKYKKEIAKLVSADAVADKIRQACANTIKRAIEFESPDLLTLAGEVMKRHLPSEAELFKSVSAVEYALHLHDMSHIEELVNAYAKKIKNDPAELHQLAVDIDKYASDHERCMAIAVELAAKAAREEDVRYIMTYASLLQKTQGKEEAVRVIDEALKKYEDEETREAQQLKALRHKIQNG